MKQIVDNLFNFFFFLCVFFWCVVCGALNSYMTITQAAAGLFMLQIPQFGFHKQITHNKTGQ